MKSHLGLEIPPLGEGTEIPSVPDPELTATVISLGYGITSGTRTVISMGFATS